MLPSCLVWRGKGLVLMAAPSVMLTYGEIIWYWILLDIYLLGDRLGDKRSNRSSIGRSWWILDWCCFHNSLGYPLVLEIWSSIAWDFFYLSWSGDWAGDRFLDRDIWSSLVISIRRLWERLGVQSRNRDRYRFGLVGIILVLSSGNSIGHGIAWAIGSLIGILEAWLIGGSLGPWPVGRSLGSLIRILCLIRAWSWWPYLCVTIRGSQQYK